MKVLSLSAINYMKAQWGLDTGEELSAPNMLFSCGYYEAVAKYLVDAGAVYPVNKESKEMIRVAKNMSEAEFSECVDQCMEQDYKLFECNHCQSIHYVNSIYWHETENFRCDSCDKTGLSDPDYDPTPYCNNCGAKKRKHCKCPPRAEND